MTWKRFSHDAISCCWKCKQHCVSMTREEFEQAADHSLQFFGRPPQIFMSTDIWNTTVKVFHEIEVRERALRIWLAGLTPAQRWLYYRWQDLKLWVSRQKQRLWELRHRRYQDYEEW